ncbi:BamA/TamA family outer membrane protein [Croceibacterium sp. LX-88]|uniref:BamA/TamA family outer membrane protein n=1 Tax=Croceibacterium selenioxidans TaxID=2838833 RepID=A0ABS5W4W8_9SPHN|nr:BamA/TamA family outer membrane protein [Croceibacterium selenioxidans]MBT2134536.1 BamA/TamA family outer membrane protein [Croceibacterium selenioxidans]
MVRLAARTSTSSHKEGHGLRRALTGLAASASLICSPALGQTASPELQTLIPDEAVANPEAWAQQGVPPEETVVEELPELQADSPLAEMPLVDVPWPDDVEPVEIAPLEPEEDIQFADFSDLLPELNKDSTQVAMGLEERISSEVVLVFPADPMLFPERKEFVERFDALSTIERLDDDNNVGRLAAQAREDEALLNRLLRIYGYYDAVVLRSIGDIEPGAEKAESRPTVRFEIAPGTQYSFGAIDLGNLAQAGTDYPMLRGAFEIVTGDPLLSDKIVEERFDLDEALGEGGYPFAAIKDPELLVDHARTEGDLTMLVTPGGKYRFGTVTSNVPRLMSGKHLADIARFEPGDIYQRSLELDLRRAILATGLVGSVTMTPVETAAPANGEPGTVDIAVDMTPAKLRTISGRIGYGSGEGFKVEGAWEHRNLFPPEGMLRVRGILGTREQFAGLTFRKNNFGGRDRILTVDAYASTQDYDAYEAETVSLIGTFERISTLLFQKPFSYSAGLELVATREQEKDANGDLGPPETFFIAAVPLFAQFDASDDLLDPRKGYRVGVRMSPETSRTNGVESYYLRGQVDATYYLQTSENLVLAGRVRVASIPGAPLSAIAPSRRLYAGGGGSVRGYDYRGIGPRNSEGDPSGGRSLLELSAEARIQTGLFDGALGVVPFIDAGTVGEDSVPSFDEIKVGVGVGVRYNTGFGPLRIDVATPLNPGPNDGWIGVYVALGQSF